MATQGTDPFAASGGGVFANGGWVPKNHPSAGSGTDTSGASSWGDQSRYPDTYSFTPTPAPDYTAPKYGTSTVAQPTLGAAPAYAGPSNFSYGAFVAPDATTVQNDPGYQFRLQQGVAARDASAAARGTLRGGNQLLALEQYGQGLASDEYGNAFNRAAQTYATNYGVAKDTYGAAKTSADDAYSRGLTERNAQYGAGTDAWGRDQDERQAQFDNAYKSSQAEYQPRYASWTADNLAREAVASKMFEAGQNRDLYSRDDRWRRDQQGANDAYRYASLGQDDEQFWANLEENRRLRLMELGAGLV